MIYEVAPYGGAIYWLLLFFGMYMVTVFANRCDDTLRPNIWAGLTALSIFSFTDYNPDPLEFFMGLAVYLTIGAGVAMMKWIDLVARIKNFDVAVSPVTYSDFNTRNLLYKAFHPNNAKDDMLTLPPDPSEFRATISLWFLYWPAFTVLKFLSTWTNRIGLIVWKAFHKTSRIFYDE